MKFLHCKDCYFYGTMLEEVAAGLCNGQHFCSEHQKFKNPNGFCDQAIEKEATMRNEEYVRVEDVKRLAVDNLSMTDRVAAVEMIQRRL